MDILWHFFEIAGTIAFAISGALVGISRRMDIFGILVLALCTAIGGGVLRDLLVGRIPPNSFITSLYIVITAIVTIVIFLICRNSKWRRGSIYRFRKLYLAADTMGLASFTVTGAAVGYEANPDLTLFAVILGLVTAVGGGIIRDILAQRIPSVLREEVYALPSLAGGVVYCYLASTGQWYVAAYGAFLTVFVLRSLALRYQWSLPKVR